MSLFVVIWSYSRSPCLKIGTGPASCLTKEKIGTGPADWKQPVPISRESGLPLWVCSVRRESNPYYICQFPNLITYHLQTLRYQQLVDKTIGLFTVGWLFLINEHPYSPSHWSGLSWDKIWCQTRRRCWVTCLNRHVCYGKKKRESSFHPNPKTNLKIWRTSQDSWLKACVCVCVCVCVWPCRQHIPSICNVYHVNGVNATPSM